MRKISLLLFICWLLPAAATAQGGWQQQEAMGVVSELLGSLNRIVGMSRAEPDQPDAVMSKKSHAALVDLKVMVGEMERLDLALAAGNGKVQTYAQYQKISNLRYSIQDYARDTEIPEEVRKEADAAVELLHILDLMYVE